MHAEERGGHRMTVQCAALFAQSFRPERLDRRNAHRPESHEHDHNFQHCHRPRFFELFLPTAEE